LNWNYLIKFQCAPYATCYDILFVRLYVRLSVTWTYQAMFTTCPILHFCTKCNGEIQMVSSWARFADNLQWPLKVICYWKSYQDHYLESYTV